MLDGDQSIARGMQGQGRNLAEIAFEDDVLAQVIDRRWVGGDARRGVQQGEVILKVEAGRGIESHDFGVVDRILELHAVVHARVPRWVPTGTCLEISAAISED